MNGTKHGQGAAKAASEPTRTPERQALADAIANRDHVARLVEERRALAASISEKRNPLFSEMGELREQLKEAPTSETHRLHALLRGEEPETGKDKEAIEKKMADVQARLDASRAEQQRAEADVHLLQEDLRLRDMLVKDAVDDVVRSDPSVAAVAAELEQIAKRRAALIRAMNTLDVPPRHGGYGPYHRHAAMVAQPEGTCPWSVVRARLFNDPDAVLPMPADV